MNTYDEPIRCGVNGCGFTAYRGWLCELHQGAHLVHGQFQMKRDDPSDRCKVCGRTVADCESDGGREKS